MNSDTEKWRAYAEYLGGAGGAGAAATASAAATNTPGTGAGVGAGAGGPGNCSGSSEISPHNALSAYAGNQFFYPPPFAPGNPSAPPGPFPQHPQQYPHPALPHIPPGPPGPPGYPVGAFGNPAIVPYSAGWQVSGHPPSQPSAVAMVGSIRAPSGELVKASSTREQWYEYDYNYPDLPSPIDSYTAIQTVNSSDPAVPVLLCHTCSECGRMRSAGFHRTHPVIPGQPLISSACRRCRKYSSRSDEQCVRQVTHIRECRANEPCDWPYMSEDDVRVRVDRGRRRSRSIDSDDVYITRNRSSSRPTIIKRGESRTSLGLRALQDQIKSPRLFRKKTKVRIASRSPPRDYNRVQVDITRREVSPGPPPPIGYSQVDRVVRRQSSLPPPQRRIEVRTRSVSPARYKARDGYREVDVERRQVSQVLVRDSDDDFTPPPSPIYSVPRIAPAPRSILKRTNVDREITTQTRTNMNGDSSTYVEVSSPRVDYFRASTSEIPIARPAIRDRERDRPYPTDDEFEYYRRRASASATPAPRFIEDELSRDVEELHIRARSRSRSPAPALLYRRQARSPSPLRTYERVTYRDQSPGPASPQDRIRESGYRTVRRVPASLALPERESSDSSVVISQEQVREWQDSHRHRGGRQTTTTTTREERDGGFVTVRKWRGIDENGKPATFVEETRTNDGPPLALPHGRSGGYHARFEERGRPRSRSVSRERVSYRGGGGRDGREEVWARERSVREV